MAQGSQLRHVPEGTDTSNPFLPFPPAEPAKAEPRRIETLGDLMERLEAPESLPPKPGAGDLKTFLREMRRTVEHLRNMFRRPLAGIHLEDLVDIDRRLIRFLDKKGIAHHKAVHHASNKNKLLACAKQFGWRSEHHKLSESWAPIRAALRGSKAGSLTIVRWAVAHNIRAAAFGEETMTMWRKEMKRKKRSPVTIRQAEAFFRGRIRKAKIEYLLPLLRLASRKLGVYAKDIFTMSLSLNADINQKIDWKSEAADAKGRRIRPATARNLRYLLREICGYAEQELGWKSIESLREVLVPEVLGPMARWLLEKRGCKPRGVRVRLLYLYALLTQHNDFNQREAKEPQRKAKHSWVLDLVADLPREPRSEPGARKSGKSIAHSDLATVPLRIEAALKRAKDEVEIAWLKHDLLFFRWTLHHPWRPHNLRRCRLGSNLIEGTLPNDLRLKLGLSLAALRKLDPKAIYSRFQFLETENKAKHFVQGLVARELVTLYREYTTKHRKKLLERREETGEHRQKLPKYYEDPGTLFFNRRRKPMGEKDVQCLYTRLVEQYLCRRATPHRNRDSYAAHHLEMGRSFPALQRALWHSWVESTWHYCGRFNSSNGAVVLDREHRKKIRDQRGTSGRP